MQHATLAPGFAVSRLMVGLWQTSENHTRNVRVDAQQAAKLLVERYIGRGFTTIDGADHYGPAEDIMGLCGEAVAAADVQPRPLFFTKWVPRPQRITRELVDANIGRSLRCMRTPTLDLLQFHWWDYGDDGYITAMRLMQDLQKGPAPQIRHLGLTNFDTAHMKVLVDSGGVCILTNQVSYSLLDRRPENKMVPFCRDNNIHLLTYGTLLGGFLSDRWLGKRAPTKAELTTWSLNKYRPWIDVWGGWALFQELLQALRKVADKHKCSIANVATKWVLDKVAAVIVGARLGQSDNTDDNLRVFAITLDAQDLAQIDAVLAKGRPFKGDCGDEYRYENVP